MICKVIIAFLSWFYLSTLEILDSIRWGVIIACVYGVRATINIQDSLCVCSKYMWCIAICTCHACNLHAALHDSRKLICRPVNDINYVHVPHCPQIKTNFANMQCLYETEMLYFFIVCTSSLIVQCQPRHVLVLVAPIMSYIQCQHRHIDPERDYAHIRSLQPLQPAWFWRPFPCTCKPVIWWPFPGI